MDSLALFALAGALAGFVHDLMATGGLVLPRSVTMPDGVRILRLGFLVAIICGAAAGMVADHHWLTAALAGWAGPDFIERLANVRAAALRKA